MEETTSLVEADDPAEDLECGQAGWEAACRAWAEWEACPEEWAVECQEVSALSHHHPLRHLQGRS